MVSREFIDISVGTFITFILGMILISPDRGNFGIFKVILCLIILSANFIHLILQQLNRATKNISLGLNIFNSVSFVGLLILLTIYPPESATGFWSIIEIGYYVFIYGILTIIGMGIILGFREG